MLRNRFLVNVADEERDGILADLQRAGAITSDFYPMVRGRLTRIAGEAVGRMRRGRVDRELNSPPPPPLPPTTR